MLWWLLQRHEREEEGEAPVSDRHFLFFLTTKMPTACQGCKYSLVRRLPPPLGGLVCGLWRRWLWWRCMCGNVQG
jgi:hypothetical protein